MPGAQCDVRQSVCAGGSGRVGGLYPCMVHRLCTNACAHTHKHTDTHIHILPQLTATESSMHIQYILKLRNSFSETKEQFSLYSCIHTHTKASHMRKYYCMSKIHLHKGTRAHTYIHAYKYSKYEHIHKQKHTHKFVCYMFYTVPEFSEPTRLQNLLQNLLNML